MLYQVAKMYPPRTFYIEVEAENEDEAIELAQEYDESEWVENQFDDYIDVEFEAEEIG